MRLPLVFIKCLILWFGFAVVPASIMGIFLGRHGAIVTAVVIGALLILDALRAERRLKKILRPSVMHVGGIRLLAIEDPSSHAFVTHHLLSPEPTLWITRGALSLLPPDEILSLVQGLRAIARRKGLRFETVLTSWMIRLTSQIPSGFSEILFFRQKRSKTLLIRESVRGVLWTSVLLLLENLYFSQNAKSSKIPEEILRKLEAESRRCVPKMPVALSSHSAVSPWPDAFLTLGRTCLLPSRAVNLGA